MLARRPVGVEYSLSPEGSDFRKVAEAIQDWTDEWALEPINAYPSQ